MGEDNGVLANLVEKVAASLNRYNMLSRGEKVGVAVSGGADSVTLLHILHRMAGYDLVVLHVNHELRGSESDGDESFVRGLADSLGLPIFVRHAPANSGNIEQTARDLRRAFFGEMRRNLGLRYVALGHNLNDQAETVLYRFLRGSGLAGLAGMSPISSDGLIRPMLEISRSDTREWAAANGIEWREDSSNQNPALARNWLRLEVINPQLARTLAANAVVAQAEEAWWSERVGGIFSRISKRTPLGLEFSTAELNRLHVCEQRRVLRWAIRELKSDLKSVDLAHVEAIRRLLESDSGHDRVQIPGVDSLRSLGTLLLALPGTLAAQPRSYTQPIKIGADLALPYDGGRLCVKRMKPEDVFCGTFGLEAESISDISDLDGEVLDGAGTPDSWCIRNWQPGDEYQRAGHETSEKIKSLFQEFRVLLWERRRWPVLVVNDEIVWSRRFGAAAKFQATDASRDIVRIFYTAYTAHQPGGINSPS